MKPLSGHLPVRIVEKLSFVQDWQIVSFGYILSMLSTRKQTQLEFRLITWLTPFKQTIHPPPCVLHLCPVAMLQVLTEKKENGCFT